MIVCLLRINLSSLSSVSNESSCISTITHPRIGVVRFIG
jgi:hypothetical protein